ncbi:MAG TPA: glycosyltransferase family 39 protein [Myxococcota bacterium]|nr:glycosyltransferase family 39 protein [Myxococcota bacterium]
MSEDGAPSGTAERARRRRRIALALAALLALFGLRLVHTAWSKSFTFDEPAYVGTGLYLWRTGDYDFARVLLFHPPLTFHLASVPLLFLDTDDASAQPRVARVLLEGREPPPAVLRVAARLPFVLLTCWGALLSFAWAREVAGAQAGLLAAFLFSFSPSLLAYGPLAHSDITVAVLSLQSLYALWRWERRPGFGRLVACGIALGLALAAKQSALLLIGAFGLELGRLSLRPAGPFRAQALPARVAWSAVFLGAWLALAAGVLWASYGGSFALSTDPHGRFPDVPLPGYLRALLFVDFANTQPRPYWFLGAVRTGSDPRFMPLAFLCKEPVGFLALVAAAIASLRARRGRLGAFLAIPIALYVLTLTVWLEVPLGYRYALPLVPLLCVFVATQLAPLPEGWPRKALLTACAAIALESLAAHPSYLAFFNVAVGGPTRGSDLFLESNLDWGQDVTTLARELARRGNPPVRLALFAAEDPAAYGVRGERLRGCEPVTGWVAISANVRKGLYAAQSLFVRPTPGCYAWLDAYTPVARPGESILLYEIPERGAPGAQRPLSPR